MAPPTDLTEQLADVARLAILNRRPAITHEATGLRGITVEIEVNGRGHITGADAYVQSHLSKSDLFGTKRGG
jgi:hypothetical protein